MAEFILPLVGVALGAAAVLIALGAHRLSRQAVPTQVVKSLDEVKGLVGGFSEQLASYDARALQWRTEMDGLIESAEDVLDRVERKRRRVQAVETRAKAREGDGATQPQTDAELWARARALGFGE